jgi:hypothetical protein
MAKMLADRGVQPMHPTTVAKIEAGDRSVRINEAMEIAELFGVSMDALLGRTTGVKPGDELADTLETFLTVAEMLWPKQVAIRDVFAARMGDLEALEFEGRDLLDIRIKQAWMGIDLATKSLAGIAAFQPAPDLKVTLRDQFISGGPETKTQEDQQ